MFSAKKGPVESLKDYINSKHKNIKLQAETIEYTNDNLKKYLNADLSQ